MSALILCHLKQFFGQAKKINVLFPETSQYFLGSVGSQNCFLGKKFIKEKHENHSKYPKNRRKILRCPSSREV